MFSKLEDSEFSDDQANLLSTVRSAMVTNSKTEAVAAFDHAVSELWGPANLKKIVPECPEPNVAMSLGHRPMTPRERKDARIANWALGRSKRP